MRKKSNTLVKWFTIFLIIVFLLGTLGTGIIVFQAHSNSQTSETTK